MGMRMGPPTLLTAAEENVLVNYIKGSVQRAHPVSKKNIIDTVQAILEEEEAEGVVRNRPSSFYGNEPKRKWWRLFRSRHPTITYRTPESLSSARKSISVQVIKQWFHDLQQYLAEEDMSEILNDPSRIFNIDESGFSLSPKTGKVLAEKGDKIVFEESSIYSKVNITVVGNICANGSIPPPMIIYPRKRINVQIIEEFPDGYQFSVGKSEKGYITYETLYEFLCNDFSDWLDVHEVKRPVLVFTDWHETRNNYYLAKKLNELKIILYGLPPNTTHLMQPLDVAVFGPLKKAWIKAVRDFEHLHPETVIQQHNFAKVLIPTYYKYVTEKNIKSGFEKCGLYPFNPDNPDYKKLESAAAQREHSTSIFEGVDQGGFIERSVQTMRMETVNSSTQTKPFSYAQPDTDLTCLPGNQLPRSLCDMVLEYHRYRPLVSYYSNKTFDPKAAIPSHSPQPSTLQSPQPSTSKVLDILPQKL
ncbi:uncharacterized protein [Macrobrachium rosenbergii]|uniref:uncharacterized protein n=1 Tax=Macrobrachium rosenbergii TaxID=79674 RepID=UPI0034D41C28